MCKCGQEVDCSYVKRLISASGNELQVNGRVTLPIQLGTLQATQEFIVVSELITPVIIGVDFLSANKICLDMGKGILKRIVRLNLTITAVCIVHQQVLVQFLISLHLPEKVQMIAINGIFQCLAMISVMSCRNIRRN